MDWYRRQWEKLGAVDPYWAVLSRQDKKGGRWQRSEFFETGDVEIRGMLARAAALGLGVGSGTVVDFGCGVGRLSRAPSPRFDKVIGVDIAESMLAEAASVNADIPNIEFLLNCRDDLSLIPDNSADLVYSSISLQHMAAARQLAFIAEFCRILRMDGAAVFRTPAGRDLYTIKGWAHIAGGTTVVNALRRLLNPRYGVMEIHPVSKEKVVETLQANGMRVAGVESSAATGRGFVGYRYFADKVVIKAA